MLKIYHRCFNVVVPLFYTCSSPNLEERFCCAFKFAANARNLLKNKSEEKFDKKPFSVAKPTVYNQLSGCNVMNNTVTFNCLRESPVLNHCFTLLILLLFIAVWLCNL